MERQQGRERGNSLLDNFREKKLAFFKSGGKVKELRKCYNHEYTERNMQAKRTKDRALKD